MNTIGQVAIYNQALAAVGISKFIQAVNEGSPQANVCNLFWQSCQDQVLEDIEPNFATRYVQLQLSTKVVYGWKNTYVYPVDCLSAESIAEQPSSNAVAIVNSLYWEYKYRDGVQVPFGISEDETNGGLVISTDASYPILRYIARIINLTLWSASAINALGLLLATKIVAPLAANPKYAETAGKAYEAALSKAVTNNYNEDQSAPAPESELITVRG